MDPAEPGSFRLTVFGSLAGERSPRRAATGFRAAAAPRRTCDETLARNLKLREVIFLDQIESALAIHPYSPRDRSGVSAAARRRFGWPESPASTSGFRVGRFVQIRLGSLIFVVLASGNSRTPQSDEPQKTRFHDADGPLGLAADRASKLASGALSVLLLRLFL